MALHAIVDDAQEAAAAAAARAAEAQHSQEPQQARCLASRMLRMKAGCHPHRPRQRRSG